MKKNLGIFASLAVLTAMAMIWTGCSRQCAAPCDPCVEQTFDGASVAGVSYDAPVSAQQCAPCPPPCPPRPVCPPPCPPKPVCPPPCPPKPVCPPPCPPPCPPKPCCVPPPPQECEPLCKAPVKCAHPSTNCLKCVDGITVTGRLPERCMLGDQFPLDVEVRACDDVCNVIIEAHLPETVSYIKSNPEAQVNGKDVSWKLGSMQKGEARCLKVWLRCECEGDVCACFCASAQVVRFCSLLCAKPLLVCEKCATPEVCPGDCVNFSVSVTNRGSCTAEEVVITDNLPDGFEHASCQKTLVFKLGCLEPCQTKKVNFTATATKRGKFTNSAVVTACNADSTSCQATTCVCCCAIDITKNGPKEQGIGKNADYQITVSNTGDKLLTDVIVTDNAPSATSIVAAQGATINGNQAVWRLKELKPGEKVSFTITLTTCTPGCFTNKVNVSSCQGCNAQAQFTTRWKGRPALDVCVTDSEDLICVGDLNTYKVSVVNRGSEADNNVVVTVRFPAEIQPISGSGPTNATVNGQTVTFAPLNNFAARQTLEYRVEAKAVKSGDARVITEVKSDSVTTPIVQQESTIVN